MLNTLETTKNLWLTLIVALALLTGCAANAGADPRLQETPAYIFACSEYADRVEPFDCTTDRDCQLASDRWDRAFDRCVELSEGGL